jgi:hypothetical protein
MTKAEGLTADAFTADLYRHQSDEELRKIQRYFKTGKGEYGEGDTFMGVRMGDVFALAKRFIDIVPDELETLLESDIHEVRAGALSIMDKKGRRKKTAEDERKALYDLYLRRHDRINNWDLVDLGAPFVVGAYLFDKPRDVLYELARSNNLWERRTAIVSTACFIRQGQVDDTFALAEVLLHDHRGHDPQAGRWLAASRRWHGSRATAGVPRQARGDDAADGVAVRDGAPARRNPSPLP